MMADVKQTDECVGRNAFKVKVCVACFGYEWTTLENGWFLMCVAERDEEVLLTGLDRLRTQLLQRKFLHGRW